MTPGRGARAMRSGRTTETAAPTPSPSRVGTRTTSPVRSRTAKTPASTPATRPGRTLDVPMKSATNRLTAARGTRFMRSPKAMFSATVMWGKRA